ncbi:MAG: endonuclease/exonuclease/phosphatase family protein [Actinomycetota bacterium]
MIRVRVATANLHGLREGIEGAAEIFRSEGIDLAIVQESGPRGRLRTLAERAGMHAVPDPPALLRRRVQNAILVRRPWEVASVEHHRFDGADRWHPRGAVVASLLQGDLTLTAISTHLGVSGAERVRHARALARLIRARYPFVLGGDLNAEADSATVRCLSEIANDVGALAGATFPAGEPLARIDYLFVSPGIGIFDTGVRGGSEVSDHLMVVAGLDLGGAGT